MKYKKIISAITTAAVTLSAAPLMALAFHSPEHYTLDGNASYITPGNASDRAVRLVSDSATSTFYGAIDFGVGTGTAFADLTTLMTDYRLPEGDTCVGGSPRFQIALASTSGDTGNIFAYFGTDSAGAPCVAGVWTNTGDFLEIGRLLDTSQLDGGTFYDTYAAALSKYGGYEVTGISVVTDSSWATTDNRHVVDIDNTTINSTLFTYEVPVVVVPTPTNKDQCKNGGWKTLADDNGNSFKNQGDCVSFVATKGKNKGSGN